MSNFSVTQIVTDLKKLSNPKSVEGMARFGINPEFALGISIPTLRKKAKKIGVNHKLALELWKTEIHEARILATMIDDYKSVAKTQMDNWVRDFNSWDLCDQCCNNLFRKTTYAIEKSFSWIENDAEFIRRAGFVLISVLAVHNKEMTDKDFLKYFPPIEKHSVDERNFVKKAVNWAVRQIGKRNLNLNREAIVLCNRLIAGNSKSAKWIGQDALRELKSDKIKKKLLQNKKICHSQP